MSEKHTMPPASKPFPGSCTPGWNDPPPLQNAGNTPIASGARSRLNKRVAFPVLGETANTSTKPTAIVAPNFGTTPHNGPPPPPMASALPPNATSHTGIHAQQIAIVPPMNILEVTPQSKDLIFDILRRQAILTIENSHEYNQTIASLDKMEQEWATNEMNNEIKKTILQFAKDLEDSKGREAWNNICWLSQRNLATKSWFPALYSLADKISPNESFQSSPDSDSEDI